MDTVSPHTASKRRKLRHWHTCAVCNRRFRTIRRDATYCRQACRQKAYELRQRRAAGA